MSRGPYTDAELGVDARAAERAEALADARAESPPRSCPVCLDRGCPACWESQEDDE